MTLPFRKWVERASRGQVLRRSVPRRYGGGALYVSPDSALRHWLPGAYAFDPELLAVAHRYTTVGGAVWDVGANAGVFSVVAAHRAGPSGEVVSIEADPWLAELLRRTARLRTERESRINVLSAAASSTQGLATLLIAGRGRASNALETVSGRSEIGGVREQIVVPTVTLDSLLDVYRTPTLIKIDVEGAEALVLRGATRVLHVVRPVIYCEVGHEQAADVTSIFREARYRLFDPSQGMLPGRPSSTCTFNTLAFPEESE